VSKASERKRNRRGRQQGSATIEFAMVLFPFLIMSLSIIEAGLFYFRATLIESAVYDAGRFIRTGEAATMSDAAAAYRVRLCDRIVMVNCDDIIIEVLSYPSFSAAASDPPRFDEEGDMESRGFSTGAAKSVMVARASLRYSFVTPMVGTLFTGHIDHSFTLTTVAIFQNEPYETTGAHGS
jgi:hypothetical protein